MPWCTLPGMPWWTLHYTTLGTWIHHPGYTRVTEPRPRLLAQAPGSVSGSWFWLWILALDPGSGSGFWLWLWILALALTLDSGIWNLES